MADPAAPPPSVDAQVEALMTQYLPLGPIPSVWVDRLSVRALLSRLLGQQTWQPIEALPTEYKDGRWFLAGGRHPDLGWLWSACRWQSDVHEYAPGYFVMKSGGEPTHWMPLPPPPAPSGGPHV